MRKPLAVSILFHAAILFWALAVFPTARDEALEPQPVAVEMVTPAEVTKIRAGLREAQKEPPLGEKKPEEPAASKDKDEAKAKAVRVAEPKPSPEPAEPAPNREADKPKPPAPEKMTEAAPTPPPSPARKPPVAPKFTEPLKPEKPETNVVEKPAPRKKNFDADRIAALLNKAPDAGAQTPPAADPRQAAAPPEPDRPVQGQPRGNDLQMSLSEIDALRARISRCWNPPVGGLGADGLRVKLRLRLNRDGMLAERPEVVNHEPSAFFQAAADSAIRAVMLCQPYALPSEKYALWRDMILNFDPREMLGG